MGDKEIRFVNIAVMIILVAYVQRDVEKRQARVAVSLGLTVTLHISILSLGCDWLL